MKLIIASLLAWNAMAGEVGDWAAKWVKLSTRMSKIAFGTTSPAEQQRMYADYMALFHTDALDCSSDPYNAIVGYNLEHATFTDCVTHDGAGFAEVVKRTGKREWNQFKILDVIVDETAKTASIWFSIANSGRLNPRMEFRKAARFKLVDGKATSYHMVFDSYNLLVSSANMIAQPESSGTPMLMGVMGAALFGLGFLSAKIFQKKNNAVLEQNLIA
jgi:hypothetical protein